jgi:prolyl 4-hydroxylase
MVIPNFLSKKECDYLIDYCRGRVSKSYSPKYNPSNNKQEPVYNSSICNNYLTYVRRGDSDMITAIIDRISTYTGFGVEYFEPVQMLKYIEGGYYKLHVDNSYDDNPRKATFQIYLNDVEGGGETIFPKMDLKFTPQMGKAIFWYNFLDDSHKTADLETIHEGALVTKGEKWGLTQWIKLRPIKT